MELESRLMTSMRIYTPTRHCCRLDYDSFFDSFYQPRVASKVIGLAFLNAVMAWEDFLQESFLGYMCGHSAPNGYAPKLRCGAAADKRHAAQVLAAELNSKEADRRLRWNSFRWVVSAASIHFHSKNPYSTTPELVIKHLEYATTIRNRVAHNSGKARSQFKTVSNQLRNLDPKTALPRGFSPGQLLIEEAQDTFPSSEKDDFAFEWGDNFEAYICLWLEQAARIVPEANL